MKRFRRAVQVSSLLVVAACIAGAGLTTDFRDLLSELITHHFGRTADQVFPGYKPTELLGLVKV